MGVDEGNIQVMDDQGNACCLFRGELLHPVGRLERECLNEPAIANEVAMTPRLETVSNTGYGVQGPTANSELPLSTPADVRSTRNNRFARHSRGDQRHRHSTAGAKPWAFGVSGALASEGAGRLRAREEAEYAARSRRGGGSKGLDGNRSRVKALSSSPTLRRDSVTLRSDLEDAARVVCQLHGRLAKASNWTEHLIRERNVSRNEVARLEEQVQKLELGLGALSSSLQRGALRTPNGHHHHDAANDNADADNLGSTDDEGGCTKDACDEPEEARSQLSSPLSQGKGCDRMVPMFTPPIAHGPRPDAHTTREASDSRQRPAEAKERSADSLVEDTGEDLREGVGRILEPYARPCASGGETNDGRSEELVMRSGGKTCRHQEGLTANANNATSMRHQRAQSAPMGDGRGLHSGETRRRGARESPGVWSNGSDGGKADTGYAGQGGKRFAPRHGRARDYLTLEEKTRRHRGGKQKQSRTRSTGEQTPGDGLPVWDTAAVSDKAAGGATPDVVEVGADLVEVWEILDTLAALSTKLRRLSLAEGVGAFRPVELRQEMQTVANDGALKEAGTEEDYLAGGVSTDRSTRKIPTVYASGGAVPPCERCATLSEAVQDARGKLKLQESLLEQTEELRLTREDRFSRRVGADREGGKATTAGNVNSSTCVKSSLDSQLSDQEEALASSAKREAEESKEAFSKQSDLSSAKLQELSSAQAALRMQELETERWKSEAEKSSVKEKSARRTLESVRIAAGDATRRSERKIKALRAEADDLRKNISSHKTRLACVQGRRQTELEMANKKVEHLEHAISHLESALMHDELRRNQKAKASLQHARRRAAESPPVPRLDNEEPSQKIGRSTSISPEVSGENSHRTCGVSKDSSDASACEIKGGSNAGGTGHDRFIDDSVREKPVAPSHSRPAASAESATPLMTTAAVEIGGNAEGGGRSSSPSCGLGDLAREPLHASARKGEQREAREGGRNGNGRRRASEAAAAVNGQDRWVSRVEKKRRVNAPAITGRVAQEALEADRERVLRRARQLHRPPYAALDQSSSGRNCKGKPGRGAVDVVAAEEVKRGENTTISKSNAITRNENTISYEGNLSSETNAVGGSLVHDSSPPLSRAVGWKAALVAALRAKVVARVATADGGGRNRESQGAGYAENVAASREQAKTLTREGVRCGVRAAETTNLGVGSVVESAVRPADGGRKEDLISDIGDRGTGRSVEEEVGMEAGIDDVAGEGVNLDDSPSCEDGFNSGGDGAEPDRSTSAGRAFTLRHDTAKGGERVRHGPSKIGLSGNERDGNGWGRNGGSPSRGDVSDHEIFFEADVQPGNRCIPRGLGPPPLAGMQGSSTYDPCEISTQNDREAGGNGARDATRGRGAAGANAGQHFPEQQQFLDAGLDFWNSVGNAGLSEEDLVGVVAELTEEEAEALLRGRTIPKKRRSHDHGKKQVVP